MQTVAGILLLLIVLANVEAWLRGGASGVAAWWHSKLVGGK